VYGFGLLLFHFVQAKLFTPTVTGPPPRPLDPPCILYTFWFVQSVRYSWLLFIASSCTGTPPLRTVASRLPLLQSSPMFTFVTVGFRCVFFFVWLAGARARAMLLPIRHFVLCCPRSAVSRLPRGFGAIITFPFSSESAC